MQLAPSKWDKNLADATFGTSGLFQLLEPSPDLLRILASHPEINVAAFCEHPAAFLATATIEKESSILESALDSWCESAQLLLALWRKNRARVDLFNWDECAAFPGELLDWFNSTEAGPGAAVPAQWPSVGSLFWTARRAMCDFLVREHRQAPRLWGEIQAACRPLSHEYKSRSPVEGAIQALHSLLAAEAENGASLEAVEAARAAQSSTMAQLDTARAALDNQVDASGKTHRLLLQEVRKAFEESEDHFQRWKSAEADRDRRVAELQARIDSMASRWTWRLGTPFRFGWDKTRNAFIKISRLPITLRILLKHYRSGLFNHEWYFEQNPDVKASTPRPFIHFAFHGVFEGRAPHQAYNETDYLLRNSVVKSSPMPPLVHYVLKGFTPRK